MTDGLDARIAALAAAQHGVFGWHDVVGSGATRSQVRRRVESGRWERLRRGVFRLAGAPETWEQRLMAACIACGPATVVSHRAAARLYALDGIDSERIELTVPRGQRPRVRATVHQAAADREDRRELRSLPVTAPERTLLDLAGVVRPAVAEQALDDALRRGITSLPRLRHRFESLGRRGRPGTAVLRALVSERATVRDVRGSVLEARFLRLLRAAGLPEPRPQLEVHHAGRLVARVDFAYPRRRIAVELDGYAHHSDRQRWQRDRDRQNRLVALGWTVLRFTWADVHERPEATARILAPLLRDEPARHYGA